MRVSQFHGRPIRPPDSVDRRSFTQFSEKEIEFVEKLFATDITNRGIARRMFREFGVDRSDKSIGTRRRKWRATQSSEIAA